MKILTLCYEWPPVGGGGGRVAMQVAEGLAQRGHQVKAYSAGLRHLARHEMARGVEVFRPESYRRREDTCSVPEMALYLLTGFLPAWREARTWKPDIIHAHFAVPTGVLAWALARLTGIPYVLTVHLGDVPGGVPEQTAGLFRLVDPFARRIWADAAAVTAVSSHVAALAQTAYGISGRVILNGTCPIGLPEVSTHTPPRLLMVGRLSIQKNPLLAVRALALVRDLDWTLDVIGEGPLGDEMRHAIQAQGLAEKVRFRGWLAGAEVAQSMREADLLLMTSLHEGLPMVAVEALQHGLAIVGSDIGGMRDVVAAPDNGFLCPLTPEGFAAALREVMADPALLQKQRSASLAKARDFDLDRSVRSYEEALLDAARRKA